MIKPLINIGTAYCLEYSIRVSCLRRRTPPALRGTSCHFTLPYVPTCISVSLRTRQEGGCTVQSEHLITHTVNRRNCWAETHTHLGLHLTDLGHPLVIARGARRRTGRIHNRA